MICTTFNTIPAEQWLSLVSLLDGPSAQHLPNLVFYILNNKGWFQFSVKLQIHICDALQKWKKSSRQFIWVIMFTTLYHCNKKSLDCRPFIYKFKMPSSLLAAWHMLASAAVGCMPRIFYFSNNRWTTISVLHNSCITPASSPCPFRL